MEKIKKIINGILIIFTFTFIFILVYGFLNINNSKHQTTNNDSTNKTVKMVNQDQSIGNEIIVFFRTETAPSRCKEIALEIGGNLNGARVYTIVFDDKKFNTYEEGKEFCNQINDKYDEIVSAHPNRMTTVKIDD